MKILQDENNLSIEINLTISSLQGILLNSIISIVLFLIFRIFEFNILDFETYELIPIHNIFEEIINIAALAGLFFGLILNIIFYLLLIYTFFQNALITLTKKDGNVEYQLLIGDKIKRKSNWSQKDMEKIHLELEEGYEARSTWYIFVVLTDGSKIALYQYSYKFAKAISTNIANFLEIQILENNLMETGSTRELGQQKNRASKAAVVFTIVILIFFFAIIFFILYNMTLIIINEETVLVTVVGLIFIFAIFCFLLYNMMIAIISGFQTLK